MKEYHFELTPKQLDWLKEILEKKRDADREAIRRSDDGFKTLMDRNLPATLTILDKLKNAEHENTNEKL
jgi:hypothetical protein